MWPFQIARLLNWYVVRVLGGKVYLKVKIVSNYPKKSFCEFNMSIQLLKSLVNFKKGQSDAFPKFYGWRHETRNCADTLCVHVQCMLEFDIFWNLFSDQETHWWRYSRTTSNILDIITFLIDWRLYVSLVPTTGHKIWFKIRLLVLLYKIHRLAKLSWTFEISTKSSAEKYCWLSSIPFRINQQSAST
jgi:hypothetical protein